jgi:hypothetical protein
LRLKELISWAENPRSYTAGLLFSLVMALLVVVAIGVLGEYTKTSGRFLLSALLLAGYCLISLGPAVLAKRNVPRKAPPIVSKIGLMIAALAIVLLLAGVWATPNSDGFWKAAAITTLLAMAFFFVSWTNWLDSPIRLARRAAGVSATATMVGATMAGAGIAFELKTPPYWWAFTLVALLWVLSGLFVLTAVFWGRRNSNI